MAQQASERVVNGVKTRILHNKDYVEVAERLRIVHQVDETFEQVETTQFDINGHWFVRCEIRVKGKKYLGTAEIKFDAPKNTPDGTNPMECAETSALGRALAFAGLGTLESIASYEEIARREPFVAVVEQGNGTKVIESGNGQRQLPQAKPQVTKEQIKPLYLRGGRLKLYVNEAEFWGWVAHVLGWEDASLSKLSADLLADLQGIMDSEEARKAQPVGA